MGQPLLASVLSRALQCYLLFCSWGPAPSPPPLARGAPAVFPSPPECSPRSLVIGKSQVSPTKEEAWLPGEPEEDQDDKEKGDSYFGEGHGAQPPVLCLDDSEGCLLLTSCLFAHAEVLPEAAGRGAGQLLRALHQAGRGAGASG